MCVRPCFVGLCRSLVLHTNQLLREEDFYEEEEEGRVLCPLEGGDNKVCIVFYLMPFFLF